MFRIYMGPLFMCGDIKTLQFAVAPGYHSNSRWLSTEKAAGICCVDEDK